MTMERANVSGRSLPEERVGEPLKQAAGERPGLVAKKLCCWRCGGDLLFNSERFSRLRLRLNLFCPKCGLPRVTDLHLDPDDLRALAGEGE